MPEYQNDMEIANGTGAVFRADLNEALKALASNSKKSTSPSTTFAGQFWLDVTTHLMKMRDESNAAWISLFGTVSGEPIEKAASDVASASTADIGASTGNYLNITGTTTITSLGTCTAGIRRVVRFTGTGLTLTYNATSLILPGGKDLVVSQYDVAEFVSLGGGNWVCTNYLPNTIPAYLEAAEQEVTYSATITVDFSLGATAYVDLTGNCTISVTNLVAGHVYRLCLVQAGSGSYDVTAWTGVDMWQDGSEPTLTTTVGHEDWVTFVKKRGEVSAAISPDFY